MALTWWMRIVGAFYLLLFVLVAFALVPVEAEGPPGVLAQAAAGDPVARFVVDTWRALGLLLGVLGGSLLVASRAVARARALVLTIIAVELVWGIGIDFYKIARGYPVGGRVVWIVIHSIIIVTGLAAIRRLDGAAGSSDRPAIP